MMSGRHRFLGACLVLLILVDIVFFMGGAGSKWVGNTVLFIIYAVAYGVSETPMAPPPRRERAYTGVLGGLLFLLGAIPLMVCLSGRHYVAACAASALTLVGGFILYSAIRGAAWIRGWSAGYSSYD
jgi:hypothetical protein